MSEHFRIESTSPEARVARSIEFMRVYAKSNDYLPQKIDTEKRFATFFAEGRPFLDRIHNFEVRKDDVWVVTMPKSGTTWMLELAWLLKNDLDYETALKIEQEERCFYLEYCTIFAGLPDSIGRIEKLKSPRVIKSHLPMHMLPKGLWTVKPKIIYVSRDPKDSLISLMHYARGLGGLSVAKEHFIELYLADNSFYLPYWSHVLEFWKIRNEPYIYFTSFERMKKDLRGEVRQISEFLERPLTNEQLEKLADHLTFEKMKDNPSCNHLKENGVLRERNKGEEIPFRFIRKGAVGAYKEELSSEAISKLDEWTQKALKPLGVTLQEILFS